MKRERSRKGSTNPQHCRERHLVAETVGRLKPLHPDETGVSFWDALFVLRLWSGSSRPCLWVLLFA